MYTICFARFMGSCFRSRMKQVHRTLNDIPVATPIISPWQLPWENMYCWLYTIYIYIPLTSHEYSTNISLCPHYTSDSDVHVLFCRKVKLCHRFLFTHLASNLSSENGMFSW